ncbi:MAG: aminopeptidase P family protein [Flavobacteriales bacterium]|nr:aminopeptidase P family protein [Flavobacteriales bacterium]
MRYPSLTKEFYTAARARFGQQLQPGGIAIFCSNDTMPTSADGHLPFKQSSDIFYLSGVDQEESTLIIFPDSFHPHHKEILFLKETSETIAIWEGAKLSKEQAKEQTGIRTVLWLGEFEKTLRSVLAEAKLVYLNSNEHIRAVVEVETREMRFSKWFREHYPHYSIERSAPIMHSLRAVKEKQEIAQLQKAIDITQGSFMRVMKFIKPGVMEYEIEAEYAHEFLRNGSRGFAYTPIIASGFSACVLHYIDNDKACKDGDVLLMDVGAEFGNYNADMTRCVPVNGKFTPRQKAVYNAVLRVMRGAASLLKPGVYMHDYHKQVGDLMEKELLDLKLISKEDIAKQDPAWPAYKKYFMHGTSHFLGLDVHDVGNWNKPVEVGNVFTVEPGIYIREESLGIRIENNIVITKTGHDDLFKDFPIEAEHIEEIINN